MEYGRVPGVTKPVSRLVQGTLMISSKDLDHTFALLDEILSLGGTTFDTAHVYGQGEVERTIGQWINQRGVRDHVVIIGKGAHHNVDRQRVTPFDITADLHDSLARLKSDYIDLYLLHRDDPNVPVGPIVETLNEHVHAGRISAFGASNWSHQRIAAANDYAAAHGLVPFVASSPQLSLAEQRAEPWPGCVTISGAAGQAARAWYAEQQMPLLTWSSLASGFFTGRFRRDNLDSFENYFDRLCVMSYASEDNFQRLDRTWQLAEEREVTAPQIALAYVLSQALNIFALVGCNSGLEFKANIEATTIRLTETELAWLDLQRDSR